MISKTFLSIATVGLFTASSLLAAGTGSISGKVTLNGKAPAEKPIKLDGTPDCKAMHSSEITTTHYVVDANGNLANVFVYVKDGLAGQKFEAPKAAVVLDQAACLYKPYVIGIQVGQPLTITNSDATMHNVHILANKNKEQNIAQASKGAKNDVVFDKPEVFVKFMCNVHPWMFAFVGVVDHPFFAVSGADGSFKIPGLPDGEYTVAAVHPKAGEQTMKVKVTGGGEGKADFKVTPKTQ